MTLCMDTGNLREEFSLEFRVSNPLNRMFIMTYIHNGWSVVDYNASEPGAEAPQTCILKQTLGLHPVDT